MDDYPPGYGKVAAFETCDPNFLMYRKFSWLHARLLLHRQDELVELQEELERLDSLDKQDDPQSLISRRRGDATNPRRRDILQDIEKKLSIYGPAHHC